MANTGIIIQARVGSSRLPGKMLLPLNDHTVLEYLIERLLGVSQVDNIVLATTDLSEDNPLEDIGESSGIEVYRGESRNVLGRFIAVARRFNIDPLIRICGDNIFIEPTEIERMVTLHKAGGYDYSANALPSGKPLILTGTGLAVEVVSFTSLEEIYLDSPDKYQQEHVTPIFYENPKRFNILLSTIPFQLDPSLRLTLDVEDDFAILKQIYSDLYPNITIQYIQHYLASHPKLIQKMKDIGKEQSKGR